MTSTDVTAPKSFDDRMLEMLRDNLGKMMTDEEMKRILERGIEKLLFQPRTTVVHSGYNGTVQKDPLIQEMLQKELQPLLAPVLAKWMEENKERLEEIIAEVLGKNQQEMLAKALDAMFSNAFTSFRFALTNDIQNMIQR